MADYNDFDITMNMKTILLFEKMGGKSFHALQAEDFPLLVYSSLVANNSLNLTFSQFESVMTNRKIAKALCSKCQKELDFIAQFTPKENEGDDKGGEPTTMTDMVNALILNCNIDINYAMNELRLWELPALVKAMEEKTKTDMVEKRFWTYLQIAPHIDGRKVKNPEQLLPFPWEKENRKKDSIRFMEDNRDAIRAFFNRDSIKDGTVQVQPQ